MFLFSSVGGGGRCGGFCSAADDGNPAGVGPREAVGADALGSAEPQPCFFPVKKEKTNQSQHKQELACVPYNLVKHLAPQH
jgi:hypothetical protein